MTTRPAHRDWQDVLQAFEDAYASGSAGGSAAVAMHRDDVVGRLRRCRAAGVEIAPPAPLDKPVCAHLSNALERGRAWPTAAFIDALSRIAARLAWQYGYQAMPQALRASYAYAEVLGPRGPVVCRDLVLGLVLFGPGCRYPRHAHPGITESYLGLSGFFSQNDAGVWAPGSLILNPAGHEHAITADAAGPALLAYAWTAEPARLADVQMEFSASVTP